MSSNKQIFISHSHADHGFADRLAKALIEKGQDVWFDKWEILPGDSIVNKIFEEGLTKAAAFAVILSKESVRSAWVREELNVATLRRIENLARVIPIITEDVEIPFALRTLRWVDMRADFDSGVRLIVNALHNASDKPPLGKVPQHLQDLAQPVSGLSRIASTVGHFLLNTTAPDEGFQRAVLNRELADALKLTPTELNDAVDELLSQGLAKTNDTIGNHPFSFEFVELTYLIYHAFREQLSYDPIEDVKVVISALAALETADGKTLESHSKLSHGRLNRAVEYINDHGYAEILFAIGTAPYCFYKARATRVTRQMAGQG